MTGILSSLTTVFHPTQAILVPRLESTRRLDRGEQAESPSAQSFPFRLRCPRQRARTG